MTVLPIHQRAKRSRIGRVYFVNNRMVFYAGLCECENCGVKGKVLLNIDDAREFGRMFGSHREPLGARIARQLAKHYGL